MTLSHSPRSWERLYRVGVLLLLIAIALSVVESDLYEYVRNGTLIGVAGLSLPYVESGLRKLAEVARGYVKEDEEFELSEFWVMFAFVVGTLVIAVTLVELGLFPGIDPLAMTIVAVTLYICFSTIYGVVRGDFEPHGWVSEPPRRAVNEETGVWIVEEEENEQYRAVHPESGIEARGDTPNQADDAITEQLRDHGWLEESESA